MSDDGGFNPVWGVLGAQQRTNRLLYNMMTPAQQAAQDREDFLAMRPVRVLIYAVVLLFTVGMIVASIRAGIAERHDVKIEACIDRIPNSERFGADQGSYSRATDRCYADPSAY